MTAILKPTKKGYIVENTKVKCILNTEVGLRKAFEIMKKGAVIDITDSRVVSLPIDRQILHMIVLGKAHIEFESCNRIEIMQHKAGFMRLIGFVDVLSQQYETDRSKISTYEISELARVLGLYWSILKQMYNGIGEYEIKVDRDCNDKYRIRINVVWGSINTQIRNFINGSKTIYADSRETLVDSIKRWNQELNSGYLIFKRYGNTESYMNIPKDVLKYVIEEIKHTVNV